MQDEAKTKRQLVEELGELRRRVAALEAAADGPSNRRPLEATTQPGDPTPAEEDRDRLRAILTAAIECLPFEFFVMGTDGHYLSVNAVSRGRFGDGVGKRPEDYAPDEATLNLWRSNNRRALAGEKVEGEYERVQDGQTRHFYNVITPIEQDGKFYGILGVNIDITDRKLAAKALQQARDELERRVVERTAELTAANERLQREVQERQHAESALRQSEEQYRGLLEACPDAVLMTDPKMQIVFASPQAWTLLGVPPDEELVGSSSRDIVVESDRPRLQANFFNVLAEGLRRSTEYTILRHDGTTVPAEASSATICGTDGKPKAVMVVLRDITDRKRAEIALRASEERFRAAFEEAPVGIVMVRPDSAIVRVNHSFCRMSGYSQEELLGKNIGDLTHPDDRDRFDGLWQQMADGEISSYDLEKRYVGKDAGIFWSRVTTVAIRGTDGSLDYVLGIIVDITDRRKAQEALQQERRMLEYMLQASDHERQLIAYDIHDGLAQQLAGAIMQFQVYDYLREANPGEATKAYFGGTTLLKQAHLEARRLISGVRPPALDEAGVVAAIAHLVDDRGLAGGPKVEFQSKVHFRRLVPVLENAIYRIVQEGLTNALMHSQSEQVHVGLLQRGNAVRIRIQDWGLGFDPETSRKDRFGLAGIRERARLLGGTCQIKSKPGEGTTILVNLPLVERENNQAVAGNS
ncbi:MAG: PAS domain S-box protein [Thermoguttaceae bacterium]